MDELLDSALELIGEADTYAVIEMLAQHEPQMAADVYMKLQKELYWKRKQIPTMVALSRAGIQHALVRAQLCTDETAATALRSSAKVMAYDLASFTWPGWDEAGVPLTASDVAIGLDAAYLNLRLAMRLNRPDKGKANAHWVIGAQLLAVGRYDDAVVSFLAAKPYSISAGDSTGVIMTEGYVALANLLKEPSGAAVRAAFDEEVASLRSAESKDAPMFAEQLVTALSVFGGGKAEDLSALSV